MRYLTLSLLGAILIYTSNTFALDLYFFIKNDEGTMVLNNYSIELGEPVELFSLYKNGGIVNSIQGNRIIISYGGINKDEKGYYDYREHSWIYEVESGDKEHFHDIIMTDVYGDKFLGLHDFKMQEYFDYFVSFDYFKGIHHTFKRSLFFQSQDLQVVEYAESETTKLTYFHENSSPKYITDTVFTYYFIPSEETYMVIIESIDKDYFAPIETQVPWEYRNLVYAEDRAWSHVALWENTLFISTEHSVYGFPFEVINNEYLEFDDPGVNLEFTDLVENIDVTKDSELVILTRDPENRLTDFGLINIYDLNKGTMETHEPSVYIPQHFAVLPK